MIATTVQVDQVQSQISDEVLLLASDKNIASKVLTWDACCWDTKFAFNPNEIEAVKYKCDILRFELVGDRAIHISADQFAFYWEQIESSKETEQVVALAKQSGTAIWEQGCKLGYIVQYCKEFYAVIEVLTYGKGFQYAYSRHSLFQLAVDSLIEQSFEEVA